MSMVLHQWEFEPGAFLTSVHGKHYTLIKWRPNAAEGAEPRGFCSSLFFRGNLREGDNAMKGFDDVLDPSEPLFYAFWLTVWFAWPLWLIYFFVA